MNAVEIEQALSALAEKNFDANEFPFEFLEAFGNKKTTLEKLRRGVSNASDIPRGVLQRNHIHIAVAEPGQVGKTLTALRASPATTKGKAKFILATDGTTLEAEELTTGDAIACEFPQFPDHFGFFLPLAGISTIKEIKDNPIDVRATGRLNKLYVELLRENPTWATEKRRPDMNHFMARLIFCFFAEDTNIFPGSSMFTSTVDTMTERDGGNVHEVLGTIFRAMNTQTADRAAAGIPRWAAEFPYVNGGLFSGSTDVPKFTRTARSYLYQAGQLNWREINPDIFGSMIQAVADDEERGALGMHYTSVPNILKVLNPLFLDDLRAQLEAADDNKIKLLNLRKRMARIRVFDPACGSGNFLVIAYKQMREIEAEINRRRGEADQPSEIPINNFRGIELRDFPAEIARLALIIAEFQCDVLYRGQKEALKLVLPLDSQNWITCGNALRLDWLAICPPTGTGVKLVGDDLFNAPLDQSEIDFENEGGETYICGNPPFSGARKQSDEQKSDLEAVFAKETKQWKNVDYVGGWLLKAALYNKHSVARFAFVATNSLCQGQQVPIIWKILDKLGCKIRFAHQSFNWSNLAKNQAAVTVVVIGADTEQGGAREIYSAGSRRVVSNINPYLTENDIDIIDSRRSPLHACGSMEYGIYYSKSAGLLLGLTDKDELVRSGFPQEMTRRFVGSAEFINGLERYCLWIADSELDVIDNYPDVVNRIESVRIDRLSSEDKSMKKLALRPHQFRERKGDESVKIVIPIHSSENREYLPVGVLPSETVISNAAFAIYNPPTWNLAILASRLHIVWVATVCGKIKTDYRYSNTLGWNTFPVPPLTEQNKADLIACAEEILLAREAHFPDTIADLYDPEQMPDDLRRAHEQNDEVLERIYIGRKFKNDTERLEKLFDLYTKMTADQAKPKKGKAK